MHKLLTDKPGMEMLLLGNEALHVAQSRRVLL